MPVPYTFGTATAAIPLSQLDSNFSTAITIGNTAVQLGNTVTTLNNMTLANVTISSGNVTLTNVSVTTANVSGTANVSSLVVLTNETVLGNTTVTGNVTASTSVVTPFVSSAAATNLLLKSAGTTAVTIDTSQNVGIGITSPSTPLHVKANSSGLSLRVQGRSSDGYADISLYNNANTVNNAFFGSSNTTTFLGTGTTIPLTFQTNNAEVGRFDSSGNLGLGVTPSGWSGRTAFQFGAAGQLNYSSGISNGGSTGYGNNSYWNGSADKAITTGYSQIVALNDNGTGRVIILTTSGTSSAGASISYTAGPYVAAGGVSWTNSSDERLKNITGEIQNGLSKVCSLRAAEFTWKDDASNKPQVGLIAQDVQAVLPEVISLTTKYNSEDKTEYLGVSYTETIPLLVAAIKELSTQVTTLTDRITALEAK